MSYCRRTSANKKRYYECGGFERGFNERGVSVLPSMRKPSPERRDERRKTQDIYARVQDALTTPGRTGEPPLVEKFSPTNSPSVCFRRSASSYPGKRARRLSSAGFSSARNFSKTCRITSAPTKIDGARSAHF